MCFFSVLFLSLGVVSLLFYISFLVTSSLAVPFELQNVNHENLVKSQIRQKLGSGAVTVLGTVISGSLV